MTGTLNGTTSHAWRRRSRSRVRNAAMEIDKIDARILDLVQRNNRLSSEELGAKVALSASGVQRRLKRPTKRGRDRIRRLNHFAKGDRPKRDYAGPHFL